MDLDLAIATTLDFFAYDQLPPNLQAISRGFHDLAHELVDEHKLEGPQLLFSLQQLLVAKDAAVRAAIPAQVRATPAP